MIVRAVIEATRGKFFTVLFKKRTNGELRLMNCRIGVSKHTKGGELGYSPKAKGLILVWEKKSHNGKDAGYRMIPEEGVQEIRFGGQIITFVKRENGQKK